MAIVFDNVTGRPFFDPTGPVEMVPDGTSAAGCKCCGNASSPCTCTGCPSPDPPCCMWAVTISGITICSAYNISPSSVNWTGTVAGNQTSCGGMIELTTFDINSNTSCGAFLTFNFSAGSAVVTGSLSANPMNPSSCPGLSFAGNLCFASNTSGSVLGCNRSDSYTFNSILTSSECTTSVLYNSFFHLVTGSGGTITITPMG